MMDVTSLQFMANVLGTRSCPVWRTALVGKGRHDQLGYQKTDTRVSRTASTGTQTGAGQEPEPSSRVGSPRTDVVVHLSPEALRAARDAASVRESSDNDSAAGKRRAADTDMSGAETAASGGVVAHQVTAEESNKETEELERRDREVRQHEATHKTALGPFANGSPRFTYTTGPDGQRYAVGGEVSVDLSPVPDDPQATIRKMISIRRAALAPQHPSAADRAVAADATRKMMAAQQELRAEQLQQQKREDPASTPADDASAAGSAAHETPELEQDAFRAHQQFFGALADQRGRLLDISA